MLRRFVRRHKGTIVVALVAATLTAAAPAVGHGVEHALFAHDADKVDGKHAVGSGATAAVRKGKLVATNATTGLLPNNIIAKAPDAGKLDGIDSTGFTRGNGTIQRGAAAVEPNTGNQFVVGHYFVGDPAPSPWVGVYYTCPANLANPGTIMILNSGSDTLNVFSDNGGESPNDYRLLAAGEYFEQAASPTGEHVTFQVQGVGMATIEVFSVHRANDCHAQGMAVFAN